MAKDKKGMRGSQKQHHARNASGGPKKAGRRPNVSRTGGTSIWTVILLPLVASLASIASQLSLSPVFGGIPSSLYHDALKLGCFVLAWVAAAILDATSPGGLRKAQHAAAAVPWISLAIPFIERTVWLKTETLGARWAPIVSELILFAPVYFLCILSTTSGLVARQRLRYLVSVPLWLALGQLDRLFARRIDVYIGSMWLVSRCGIRTVVGILSAVAMPSIPSAVALLGIFASVSYNLACPSGTDSLALVNSRLAPLNFTMLARQESLTGYISVLENAERKFRMLRCDHSILGGEWRTAKSDDPNVMNEPIYSVFVMLEAVRLVDPPALSRKEPEALLIGLGIGTAASGLIKSGVKSTLVELDPIVYEYAKSYFNLPSDHISHVTDAVDFVAREASAPVATIKKYDYILHDVFTGGAVPSVLFTVEFLQELKSLLKVNGVIAINYAGDLKLRAARKVLNTIISVFDSKCRAFREDDPASHEDQGEERTTDFTNMVIFCVPFHGSEESKFDKVPHFHAAKMEDFHGTWIRQTYLVPKFEIDLNKALQMGTNENEAKEKSKEIGLVTRDNAGELSEWQKESAVNHWKLMNTVVPFEVWVNY